MNAPFHLGNRSGIGADAPGPQQLPVIPNSRYREFLSFKKFDSLDGLRCFSILAVIWHHAVNSLYSYLGVEVFFGISGFLITTLLLRERRRTGNISLPKFYARRSLRIFPLYYAVLLLYIAIVYATQRHEPAGREFFHHLPFFATYTSNWFVPLQGRVIFYFAWSLATEEQFYLIVPSIEKYLSGWAAPLILFAVLLHLASQFIPMGIVVQKISLSLCFGVLAAHALDRKESFRYIAAVTYPKFCSLAWLLTLLAVIRMDANELAISVAITGLVASSVIRRDHALAPIFNWGPFQSIGRVSYGMYMLHQLCLNIFKHVLPIAPEGLFLAGSVSSYFVASASYRWFESYFLRMKERFEPKAPPRLEPVA